MLEIPILIARKRDGGALSRDEIAALIVAYMAGDVTDAQMSAFLMAGVLQGFSDDEATALTEAYLASGDVVDLSDLTGPTVDKHSTGGVGDSTTLVVAPLLAVLGCQVAKLSGRGLGHTGGTLDKLEAIPGYRVDLDAGEFHEQVERLGVAVAAATARLVPADKRIYALRDVTGTVPSEALIAASIMSKKLAGGAGHIVLDVKCGDGAFLAPIEDAVALARRCVAVGELAGRRTRAIVSDMSQPLGRAVGNALEVAASVEVLAGAQGRLRDLCVELAAQGLVTTGVDLEVARERAATALASGAALERFAAWIEAQGGDPRVAEDPWSVLPAAPVVRRWTPPSGVLASIATRRLGELAGTLGAGRMGPDDVLDPRVGLVVNVSVGDRVGDADAVEVHAADEAAAETVLSQLPALFTVVDHPVPAPDLLRRVITADDVTEPR